MSGAAILRVATLNVWHRFGPWQEREPAIIAALRAVDADVIGLQEVWATPDANQAEILGGQLGMAYVYEARGEMNGVRGGNAILSRFPIRRSDSTPLPAGDTPDERRVAVMAEVEAPRGPVQVFTTHLNWRLDQSRIRCQQVLALAAFVDAQRPRTFPPIVVGDFNAAPESDEIRFMTGLATLEDRSVFFQDAWAVAGDAGGDGCTWSNRNTFAAQEHEPSRRIDYVFVGWRRPGGAGVVRRAAVVCDVPVHGVFPSDHFGMTADISLGETT